MDNHQSSSADFEIAEFLKIILERKILIISMSFLGGLLFASLSLLIPNSYKSEAMLTPEDNDSNMQLLRQYAGLASIAGIDLRGDSEDLSEEAVERIQSFAFFNEFILPHVKKQDLIALRKWDAKTDTYIYKKRKFDADQEKWIRRVRFPKQVIPTAQEAYKKWTKHLSIDQDKRTGFVTISITHRSSKLAKSWLDLIILEINRSMREEDKIKALKALDFLQNESKKVNYAEIDLAISALQEEELKSLMMIEVNEDYVFSIIETPVAKEKKSWPPRSIIAILGAVIGFLLSAFYIYFRDNKKVSQLKY